jgi:8-hydroxy-5-deazaflavin:NADPH oxidoreductase
LMKIAIIGGTGDLGMGLAVRLSNHHDILIGSRDQVKAEKAAEHARSIISGGGSISGHSNPDAAGACDVAILAIPDLPSDEMLRDLAPVLKGKLVISPIVPMRFQDGLFRYTMTEGSAAEKVASVLQTRVAAALHTVPAEKLLRHDMVLELDVPVAAETKEIFGETAELISEISRLRPLHAGPMSVSRLLESMTPLLLNIGRFSKIRSPSIKIV